MSNTRNLSSVAVVALATGLATLLLAVPASAKNASATNAKATSETERQVAQDETKQRDTVMEEKAGGTTARRSYTSEDFARFAPRSALDMANQVPGFQIREGDGARGLGQADTNVLINGRRISGKSNGPVAALQRIPTEEVLRLELVDGASLDIGGLTGQVLNVITASSGRISGQYRYAPQIRSFGTDPRLYEGRVAIAGGGAKTDWTLALENNSGRRGDEGPELVFDGGGALIDTRQEQRNADSDQPSLSGSYTRVADNGNVLNLTGEVAGNIRREKEISQRSGSIDPADRVRDFRSGEDEFNFEIGADYQFTLGPGKLKLIAYHGYEDSPTFSTQITRFSGSSDPVGSRFTRDADEGETIARAEYSFPALGGDLLLAGEGVRNFLDIASTLKELNAASGDFIPVEFDGASARVDEDRAEFQATYSRPLASNLQFQLSIAGEYSRISQSGEFGQTRSFYRPKGFAALDWKAADGVNIAARLERLVGQLNFFDFIATVDLNQDRQNVTNADLVPQQSWRVEMEANISLGDVGTLNIRPFYEDISDIVDQIPIAGGGQAPGNLPSATQYGVETDLTLLSEGIGWRGTRVDVTLAGRGSEVRDPLLGFTRELSGFQTINLRTEARHDIPNTSWAFGGSFFFDDRADNVRLDEIFVTNEPFPGFTSVFVENKDVRGVTLRVAVANLTNRQNLFDRTVFVDRGAGIVDFIDDRNRKFGTIFTFEIEGSF